MKGLYQTGVHGNAQGPDGRGLNGHKEITLKMESCVHVDMTSVFSDVVGGNRARPPPPITAEKTCKI